MASASPDAAPVLGYADALRAVKTCEEALKRLERDSAKELRDLRRSLRGGRAADTYLAETRLFQSWRTRRETLDGELRRLKALLEDPRGAA